MKAVAIVGYGYWGPKLTRNFLQDRGFGRVLICDEDAGRLKRGLIENPGAEAAGSFAELIRDPEVEAVALATPVATHHPLALAALKAGKHVLVEKPLATRSADAEELDSLPGVGPVTAEKIVAYRGQHGPFVSLDGLDAIPGIGPARIASLKGLAVP